MKRTQNTWRLPVRGLQTRKKEICSRRHTQGVPELVYLKYEELDDMLKVIIYSSQSMLGVVPMLYYINHGGKNVLFIQTGTIGNATIHYIVQKDKPPKKFIQLKRLTGDSQFV